MTASICNVETRQTNQLRHLSERVLSLNFSPIFVVLHNLSALVTLPYKLYLTDTENRLRSINQIRVRLYNEV